MSRGKSKREFKKKVVMGTGVLFVCACLVALVFAWNEKPTDVFTYIIPTAGGVFAAAVVPAFPHHISIPTFPDID